MLVSLVPVLRALGVSERRRLHRLRAHDRRAPDAAVAALGGRARAAVHGLLDLDRRRPDDRRRRRLGDRLQRRPPARARHGDFRAHPSPCARPQDLDGVPAGKPLPHGHHPRHVHARGLHARDRHGGERLLRPRPPERGGLRRRLRRPGEHGRRHARSPTSSERSPSRPTCRPTTSRCPHRSRSCPIEARRPVPGASSSRTSSVASTPPFLRPHDLRPREDRRGLRHLRRRLEGDCVAARASPSSTALSCPGGTTSTSPPPTDFRLTGFYFDEGPFEPIDVEVRDRQTGKSVKVTIIGILVRDDAARDGRHLDVAEDAQPGLPRPGVPDHLLLRPRARTSTRQRRRRGWSPRSSPTAWRPSRSGT